MLNSPQQTQLWKFKYEFIHEKITLKIFSIILLILKSTFTCNPLSQQPPFPHNFLHLSVLATEQLSGSWDNEKNPICQHPQTIYTFSLLWKCLWNVIKSFHFLNHFKVKSSYWICSFSSFLLFFAKTAYKIDFQFCFVISFIIPKTLTLPALIFHAIHCAVLLKKVKAKHEDSFLSSRN